MNKIERQILKNQDMIMSFLGGIFNKDNFTHDNLKGCIEETRDLLYNQESKETCCDMPEEKEE